MAYRLIKGDFHIHYPDIPQNGPEPDGDTLKFEPDQPGLVEGLIRPMGAGPDFNGRGYINLRLEAVDALETHFEQTHQQLDLARQARDFVLDEIGFGAVKFFDHLPNKVESVENHPRRGYVLARTLDGHGRIVAFVFVGETTLVDGVNVWVEPATINASVNVSLLAAGLTYPAFYTSMPLDLRAPLRQIVADARAAGRGLWPQATATVDRPAEIADLAALQELVIWPKLFRRLVLFFASGHTDLTKLDAWLREDPLNRDDSILLPTGDLGNMHDLIEVTGNGLRMTFEPEDVVILPDGAAGPVVVEPRPEITRGEIRIIAALVNAIGPETGQERVTILNTRPEAVQVEGWKLSDREGGRDELTGALEPGELRQLPLSNRVRLSNSGDTISLLDAEDRIVDQVSYDQKRAQREGWTLVF